MKDSGWRFDKYNSLTLFCNKTTEKHGSSYEKSASSSSAISNLENDDKKISFGQC